MDFFAAGLRAGLAAALRAVLFDVLLATDGLRAGFLGVFFAAALRIGFLVVFFAAALRVGFLVVFFEVVVLRLVFLDAEVPAAREVALRVELLDDFLAPTLRLEVFFAGLMGAGR